MSKATLSLLGLYKYDSNIFDELVLPDGMDKTVYINSLLMETAELEVILSNPHTMRNMIGIWSSANLANWSKLWATTRLEYNPIENYDRQEEWTDDATNNGNASTISTGHGVNKDDFAEKKAGFDSGEMVDTSRNDSNSENNTQVQTNSETNSKANTQHKGRIHGNIGVTTSQQMIEEERRVAGWNMYDYLVDEFKHKFCLLVY